MIHKPFHCLSPLDFYTPAEPKKIFCFLHLKKAGGSFQQSKESSMYELGWKKKKETQICFLESAVCTHMINMFALKVKLATIMKANSQEHKNATSSQASPPSCSVSGLSGGTCQWWAAAMGRWKSLGSRVAALSRLLYPSDSYFPPLERGAWKSTCSFLLMGLF